MMKRHLFIFFTLFLFLPIVIAEPIKPSIKTQNQQVTASFASLVSLNLYNMEMASLTHVVKNFLMQNDNIQAVRVIENLDNKVVLQVYSDTEAFIIDKPLPQRLLKRNKKIKLPSIYEGELVGFVEVFFKPDSDAINLTPEELSWIENNVVKVGIESWDPILFMNDKNNIDGVSGEFLNAVVAKTGLKIEVVQNSWDVLLKGLQEKQIDLLPDTYYTTKRAKYGLYGTPYFRIQEYIYTRESNQQIKQFSDLSGKKVAVVKGFATIDFIQNLDMDIEIVETDNLKQSIEWVLTAKVDALLESRIVCEDYLKKHFISGLKGTPQFELESSRLHFFSRKDKPILQSILQKGLDNISKKEKYEIVANWISTSGHKLIVFSEQEQDWIDKKIPIKYVYDPDWVPFEWTNDVGRHSGIIADLLKNIEFNSGIQFVPVSSKTWAEAIEKAKTRQADMYSGLGETDERKEYMNFSSKNIFSTPYVFVSRQGEDYLDGFESVLGKRLALVNGYTIHGIMNSNKPDIPIVLVDNIQQGFDQLMDDHIDVFIVNAVTAKYYLSHFPQFSPLKIASKSGFNLDLKVAIRNDWPPEVLSIINKSIDAISENDLSSIYDKWTSINVKAKIDYSLLIQVLSVVFLVILVILYWNWKLKSLVRQQTTELTRLIKSYDKHVIASKINLHGEIIYVSDAFMDISGYGKAELLGKSLNLLEHQDDSRDYLDNIFTTIRNQGLWEGEIKNYKKSGDIFWVKAVVAADYDESDTIVSYSSIQHEITDKKEVEALSRSLDHKVKVRTQELKEQKESFEKLFYKTSDALFLLADGRIIDCNDALVSMLKAANKEELLNLDPAELSPELQPNGESSSKIASQMMQTCMQQGFNRFEWVHMDRQAESFWTEVVLTKIRISGKDIIHGVWRDISQQKELQKNIIEAKNRAEESTQSKSEFLANMSHEIRTPMHGIISMAYLLMQTNLDTKQAKYLKIIESASSALLGVINDILDFSKIEAGKLEIENIDFNLLDVIENVKNLVEYKAQEKDLRLTIHYDKNITQGLHGDPLRLGQVITNLANNAIKFTAQGEVSIHIIELENHHFQFVVKDTGIGLKPEALDKLFHSFTQADGSTTRKYGGTGLGLAISKQLIQLMRGDISVSSEYGQGSTFIVELKLEAEKNKSALHYNKNQELGNGKERLQTRRGSQLLLVEDNEMNRTIIHSLLEGSGIMIEDAINGKVAVDKFQAQPDKYELILTDIQMPIMDGYETAQRIREMDKHIPIIALTASAMKQDIEKTRLFGMNEHLNKPIDVKLFYAILLKYLSKKCEPMANKESVSWHNSAIDNLHCLDSKKGLAYMDGNEALYKTILLDFVRKYEHSADEIKILLQSDMEKAIRLMHSIKGLSLNIGAQELHEQAKALESDMGIDRLKIYQAALQKLINELKTSKFFAQAKSSQVNHSHQVDVAQNKEKTASELSNLLNELLAIMPKKRARLCQPIIAQIETFPLSGENLAVIQQVKQLIKKYKFQEAIEMITNINYEK